MGTCSLPRVFKDVQISDGHVYLHSFDGNWAHFTLVLTASRVNNNHLPAMVSRGLSSLRTDHPTPLLLESLPFDVSRCRSLEGHQGSCPSCGRIRAKAFSSSGAGSCKRPKAQAMFDRSWTLKSPSKLGISGCQSHSCRITVGLISKPVDTYGVCIHSFIHKSQMTPTAAKLAQHSQRHRHWKSWTQIKTKHVSFIYQYQIHPRIYTYIHQSIQNGMQENSNGYGSFKRMVVLR